MSQSKYWLLTVNNPTEPLTFQDEWGVEFAIWQLERGEAGTPHYQIYVAYKNRKKLVTVKNHFPTAHCETRRGSHQEAKTYCSKEDSRVEGPWEYGNDTGIPSGRGARTDLLAVKRALDEGASEESLWDDNFEQCCKYYRAFERYRAIKLNHSNEVPNVIVIYGPTGTGKSHYCYEKYPNAYWKFQGQWWDGYNGQRDVIIDEFYGWLPWSFLLRLLDHYPFRVETKGGSMTWMGKNIVLTSNSKPRDWYKDTINISPLARRINKFIYMPTREQHVEYDSYDEFIRLT